MFPHISNKSSISHIVAPSPSHSWCLYEIETTTYLVIELQRLLQCFLCLFHLLSLQLQTSQADVVSGTRAAQGIEQVVGQGALGEL